MIKNTISLEFSYTVYFHEDVFHPENSSLTDIVSELDHKKKNNICVFIDQGVIDHHSDLIEKIHQYFENYRTQLRLLAHPFLVPGGEICKTDESVLEGIYQYLYERGVDRHTFILAIGGGAVLDTVGYAAATAHRGIRLLRMPTTVLAQNDAGIGVKAGVNRFGVKNFIGSFIVPQAVINDASFLDTLSIRDKRAGIAEAIKAALIRDVVFFEWLEAHVTHLVAFEDSAVQYMIKRCAELHLLQITTGGDPFETGSNRPLDFGHWAAHKLESMSDHELKHGEAVAIGVAIDTRYSLDIQRIGQSDYERVVALMLKLGFTLTHPALEQRNEEGKLTILDGIDEFREHLGGETTITVLDAIGVGVEINDVHNDLMEQSIIALLEDVEQL